MKKTIILLTLILTGCLGETGKGYITKTCTKIETINQSNIETKIELKSKKGNVETITIIETYDKNSYIESITDSKKSEQNAYIKTPGIKLEINNNIFTYTINKNEIPEEIKEKFNIKDEQHNQIKYYENNGYTCK